MMEKQNLKLLSIPIDEVCACPRPPKSFRPQRKVVKFKEEAMEPKIASPAAPVTAAPPMKTSLPKRTKKGAKGFSLIS